ncbi:MAG: efflux RND transporter periplasmic adaptor subunit, partial [Zoogloea sp.]|nr:efflux RND transporter periplasmic adaptor subunit [Zoogloea sp.]
MKRKPIVIAVIAAAAIAVGAWYFRAPQAEPPVEAVIQKPSAEPGVLRFPTAAPQLAQLKVERTELAPVPMDEPLAAHVAYDENATARLFAPIPGRVVEIRANIGDTVKAGAVLAVL